MEAQTGAARESGSMSRGQHEIGAVYGGGGRMRSLEGTNHSEFLN